MNEEYRKLAAATIKQALVDYRLALKANNISRIRECKRFLRSEWFVFLSGMDGERLIAMMKEDVA